MPEIVMQRLLPAVLALALLLGGLTRAKAEVVITVNKSQQQLSVAVDGFTRYQWPVSTARWGYHTPNGSYRPLRLARKWYSRKYDMSPMPYSIFFYHGFAIHGSFEIAHIGRPASHGCIRLRPEQAAILFELVKRHMQDTIIVVTGERPPRKYGRRLRRSRSREKQTTNRYRFSPRQRDPDRGFAFPPSWDR